MCTSGCVGYVYKRLFLVLQVLYRPIDNSDTPVYKDVKGKNTTNVTLRGLRKYVSYSIQILAYTRMGDGRLSPEVIKKTDEDGKRMKETRKGVESCIQLGTILRHAGNDFIMLFGQHIRNFLDVKNFDV